jgi:hypothetical protein
MVLALLDAGETVVVLDRDLLSRLIDEHRIDAIAHFAAKIVVPESVADPLGYYLANTVKSRALIATAVRRGVRHLIFSSTAAVYGEPAGEPGRRGDAARADQPLRPLEADDRVDAGRCGRRPGRALSTGSQAGCGTASVVIKKLAGSTDRLAEVSLPSRVHSPGVCTIAPAVPRQHQFPPRARDGGEHPALSQNSGSFYGFP